MVGGGTVSSLFCWSCSDPERQDRIAWIKEVCSQTRLLISSGTCCFMSLNFFYEVVVVLFVAGLRHLESTECTELAGHP